MPSPSINPYQSPNTPATPTSDDPAVDQLSGRNRRRLEVGEVVVAWEKQRLWYNLILAGVSAPVVFFFLVTGALAPVEVTFLPAAAVGANACYCAGPIVEGYWTWFLGPTPALRSLLFIGGTVASCLLAVLACLFSATTF